MECSNSAQAPHVLREYAVIAGGERGVLVGPRGDAAWMCFPSRESPAVFSGLHGGGSYAVRGPARIEVRLDVRAGFGSSRMAGLRGQEGVWHAHSGRTNIRWLGAADATTGAGPGLSLTVELAEGEMHDLVLELSLGRPDEALDPQRLWTATEAGWHGCVPPCDGTLAPRDARLACAVLTGLTSTSGGMVAAATTSLPERMNGGRSCDYRYAWIRDQCYAGQAVAAHGGPVPAEEPGGVPGYPGSDVVTGNRITGQFQLDAFGAALQLFAAAGRAGRLTGTAVGAARVAAGVIAKRWAEPGNGIWETQKRNWTHSRLACVAGLRRFERIRSGRGTTGLFTEEYDVRQRQLRANLPQALVHALLPESAVRPGTEPAVSPDDTDVRSRGRPPPGHEKRRSAWLGWPTARAGQRRPMTCFAPAQSLSMAA